MYLESRRELSQAQAVAGVMKTGQVFVSHTSDMARFPADRSFVQATLDAVIRAAMTPVDMRYFAARDGKPADYCRGRVSECEIYVAVIGFRYGTLVPGEAISYTDLEFRAARDAELPRLVFLLEEPDCPPGLGDADKSQAMEFRHRLRNAGLIVRTFSSTDGLELEVFHALIELASREAMAEPHGQATALVEASGRNGNNNSSAERSFSGVVPRIWNVPNRNADFTGRRAILGRLHGELTGDGTAVVLARALYGLGGVGKTQVALEYAHRFKADYDLIWWIPAEQPQGISLALADLADRLGIKLSDNATEDAAAALEQLRHDTAGRWLLIFDNAEDPRDLEPFLPSGSGHVIITSRNHAWTYHADPVELDVFTRQESVAHLMRHVPGLDSLNAERISVAVGDLPLAIEQAAAWLSETGMPAVLYVERLETEAPSALKLNKPFGYAMPVAATWNLSLDRLRERSPAAVRLLQILAFCSPEPISMALLYGGELIEALLPFDETLRDKFELGHVISDVSRLALVKVDPGSSSLQIHRLVQAVIRSQMTAEQQMETAHVVHRILAGARPRQGETDDPANWSTYDLIWPHLGPSRADECDDPRTRQLLIDWVRYQWKHGEFESGLSLARRLEQLWTHQRGPEHPQTLHLQFQVANLLRSQGHFNEARDLDTYVLERQREVLGSDHLLTLMTAGSLGADLRALGEFQAALESDRQTYESFKEEFGEDYPRTLQAAFNLAVSLRLVGDYTAARRLNQEVLDRRRLVLPPDHPYTLGTAANLAQDMRATGAFRESVELLRVTWEKYCAVLGPDMIDTLRAATNLAVSLRRAGTYSEALELTQDTYDRYVKRYGPTDLQSLSCALNLACDCSALGDNARAQELATGIRAAYQATLGNDHPYTLTAASNLVIYLRGTGELAEALGLAEQIFSKMRGRLGENHPYSLTCAINVASCLADSGDLTQAATLERETISAFQKKLGPLHPDTLACEANHAITLHWAEHHQQAEQIKTRVLDGFRRALGPQHPDTKRLQDWQRIDRDLESQLF